MLPIQFHMCVILEQDVVLSASSDATVKADLFWGEPSGIFQEFRGFTWRPRVVVTKLSLSDLKLQLWPG